MPPSDEQPELPRLDDHPELPLFDDPPPPSEPPAPEPIRPTEPPSSEPGTRRLFLGWDRPVLAGVVDRLLAYADGSGTVDLSDTLVIVPTRNAGRRLRESLAVRAAERDAAVFPPLVSTQDFLSSPERLPSGGPLDLAPADHTTARLIWAATLRGLDLDHFRNVFPVDPIGRDLLWAGRVADELLAVRQQLTRGGLDFASAAAILGENGMEPARWEELARIERLAVDRSESLGLADDTRARFRAAEEGRLPAEVGRIVIAAVSELDGLAARALSHLGKTLPVEILVAAPEDCADRFDSFGRPETADWSHAFLDIPEPETRIHDAATPTLQAELACDLLSPGDSPAAWAAVGVPDPEVVAPLEQAATRRGWTTHDPAGRPLSRHAIHYLLEQTAELVSGESFATVGRLLRIPEFAAAMSRHVRRETGSDTGPTRLVRQIDELHERTLPDRLEDAVAAAKRFSTRFADPAAGLAWIADWASRFQRGGFEETLSAYLIELFSETRFDPRENEHGAVAEAARAIAEAEAAFAVTRPMFPKGLDAADRFQLLLGTLRDARLYDERRPDDLDLQGWLELAWEDAARLVVTGMNDHVVPESVVGHAYLPDSARRALGLPDNDSRFARDAYLLTLVLETRRKTGRVDLVFGRQSESGDPLRPSRLLFRCPDEELPARTLQFFGKKSEGGSPQSWSLPWQLQPAPLPDDAKIFSRLSVTQFRSYLQCPFRFYLQHGLRMEEVDSAKSEMDARDFGNLLHDVLERFAQDETAVTSTDPAAIRECFEREIDAWLSLRFGPRLPTPVLIQREAARRRLAWWSEIEAQERTAGWRILETETDITNDERTFQIAGHTISGRIDRIEQHEDGRLRVFDFKTHSVFDAQKKRNKTVAEYHAIPVKRTEDPDDFPEWARFEEGGKPHRWVDLQIPLYLLSLAERFPGRTISGGHVSLGPTEAEVVLDVWEGLDEERLASAKACAEGVVAGVRGKVFWPPAEKLPWRDPFEELLFGEAEESVDSRGFTPSPYPIESPANR